MLPVYAAILRLDPQNTQASYWTGLRYLNRQEYGLAAHHFERVVSLYPFDYDANLSLAQTYLHLDRPTETRALFERVLLIRPGDAAAAEGLRQLKALGKPGRPAWPLAHVAPLRQAAFHLIIHCLPIN